MPPPKPTANPLLNRPQRPLGMFDTQVIYCGDNLHQLGNLPDQCVDLIYIDPPFNSNRNYEAFWGEEQEKRAFEDRHASTEAYINYMRPRCVALARVLKKTGSFYYHCDWHACHYVKVMLDQIFGEDNFQNEIVWKRQSGHSDAKQGSKHFGRLHDTLFFYTNSGEYTWNQLYEPYREEYVEMFYSNVEPETGRRFKYGDLTGPGGAAKGNPQYEFLGVTRYWRYGKAKMEQLYKEGRITIRPNGKVPQLKLYLDEAKGMPVQSVWTDIRPLMNFGKEAIGYPTQKPLALLERIIKVSSNPDDIVLDAFCGCGTAIVAAQNLDRRWIGIDRSPTACKVMAERLTKECKMTVGADFFVRDLPWSEDVLRKMPHFEFQNWAVLALGGITNPKKTGDKGIDGRIYPSSAAVAPREKSGLFMDNWYPVQVKQVDKAGTPEIESFQAVMMRDDRVRGYFVAFDFTTGALAAIRDFEKRTRRVIVPKTVKEILQEEAVVAQTG